MFLALFYLAGPTDKCNLWHFSCIVIVLLTLPQHSFVDLHHPTCLPSLETFQGFPHTAIGGLRVVSGWILTLSPSWHPKRSLSPSQVTPHLYTPIGHPQLSGALLDGSTSRHFLWSCSAGPEPSQTVLYTITFRRHTQLALWTLSWPYGHCQPSLEPLPSITPWGNRLKY